MAGRILDRQYKGATLESRVQLDAGGDILIAGFFDEDDAGTDFALEQRISVSWVDGWEVVLPLDILPSLKEGDSPLGE
ncbi:TOBE domain-containing protein [Oceanimonas marisflavi]|uniref:TOBE domain-containing protein n=1 Tax=Oceanimonas marisflavi TaxID=2059724 RepID=UPI000D30AD21|nr:TOBE domain-containing protein [Oceanimonas marisflavi]